MKIDIIALEMFLKKCLFDLQALIIINWNADTRF